MVVVSPDDQVPRRIGVQGSFEKCLENEPVKLGFLRIFHVEAVLTPSAVTTSCKLPYLSCRS
jgi:hypothetical protein